MPADPSVCDVAIVGAGAAGIATAIFTARRAPHLRIVLFDGARRPGAKILVSGGGRCNVTNRSVDATDFSGGNRRFVGSVLSAFPVPDTTAFFEELGVRLHEEERGKMFPDSNSARAVLDALLAEASRLGVELLSGTRVTRVDLLGAGGTGPGFRRAEAGFVIQTEAGGVVRSRFVVLATGGLSLPKTGSDGAGLAMAASLGHTIVDTTPALAPLVLSGSFHAPLAGVSHDAGLSIEVGGRPSVRLRGPMLWTHFGVSGPVALDASRHWHRAQLEGRDVRVRLSFLPTLDEQGLDQALAGVAGKGGVTLRAALARLLPAAVADAVLAAVGAGGEVRLAQLERARRKRIARALTGWDLPVTGSRGYNYAEATAGGVALDEVDRGTMASRLCPGLHLVGEMLDVDGRLGGFNFQWAWSSAWVAARGIGTKASGERQAARGPAMNAEQRIGFIGLGLMGKPMALNLLKAGYRLVVHSRSRGPVDALAAAGAEVGEGPADVARRCGVVVTMLPDSPDVEKVLAGPGGVFEGMQPGAILIDMSSISPVVTRRLAAAAKERGATLLDAPVSGGEIGAIGGTLSIMVGGEAEALEKVRPILDVMGNPEKVVHIGESGAGQVCKVCNQMAIGGALAVVGELMALARKANVDPAKVREALLGGFAASRVLEVHGQRILDGNYKPGFKAGLYDKDMGIALQTARAHNVPVPVTAVVAQLVNRMIATGQADADYSALAKVFFEMAGID